MPVADGSCRGNGNRRRPALAFMRLKSCQLGDKTYILCVVFNCFRSLQ